MDFLELVRKELESARAAHPTNMHNMHEAYAVILEEMDELKAEIWKSPRKRDYRAMADEIIQVAAMCARAYEDCNLADLAGTESEAVTRRVSISSITSSREAPPHG
jgi:hypothetical protein